MQHQQQAPQQEQCGSQQQGAQPVMLCPVQYVYETPVILPQQHEDQIQQNQILINVKNPPPWIQNRTQNQIVYVQQLPNNYQHYIHPQMIQNPIYHPQMNYQIQPMLAQDNRQFIQIPNANHYHMIQNPATQIIKEEAEKMPLLTQMLSQKAVDNRAPNNNNVRTNTTANVNIIRPITQNQQVQTDNVLPNVKGKPRNAPPQIITINPMQQRQINRKHDTLINVRPTSMRSDVPQHIRTKIPSSISVKTINNTRTIIRPFDVMTPQPNFYYDPNRNSLIMPVSNTEPKHINEQYMKPNNMQQINPRSAMPMQYQIPVSNVPPFINMTTVKNQEGIDNLKQMMTVNATVKPNVNPLQIHDDINNKSMPEINTVNNTESETQTEEKLVRNTVFVQARGRVLNDKEIIQNHSTKRTIDDRLKEDKEKQETLIIEAKSPEEAIHISKKIKIEVTENNSENNKVDINSANSANMNPTNQQSSSSIANIDLKTQQPNSTANMNIKTQQSRITNLQMNSAIVHKTTLQTPEANNINNVLPGSSQLMEDFNKRNATYKVSTYDESNSQGDNKALIKMTDKVSNDPNVKEETNLKHKKRKEGNNSGVKEEIKQDITKKKEEKITVLTHVLEGYIIQESNVAFPIQKPSMEKEINKVQDVPKRGQKSGKTMKIEDNANKKHESKGHFPWKYLNTSIESEKEMEFAVDKDNPFSSVKKSTVETWTAEQLSSLLENHGWTETAAKLLDEEIDGESILLVNKDQLLAIEVSEEHAELIVAFSSS